MVILWQKKEKGEDPAPKKLELHEKGAKARKVQN